MADLKLFRLGTGGVAEIKSRAIEKPLQALLDAKLEVLVGVRFLASEQVTGKIAAKVVKTFDV